MALSAVCNVTQAKSITILKHIADGGFGAAFLADIDGSKCVLKAYKEGNCFHQEHSAYLLLNAVPELAGRIPRLIGKIDDVTSLMSAAKPGYRCIKFGLCIDFAEGQTLEESFDWISERRLALIRTNLEETLRILHGTAQVCHGDTFGNNVIVKQVGDGDEVQVTLIDFSHPLIKAQSSAHDWKIAVANDYHILEKIFTKRVHSKKVGRIAKPHITGYDVKRSKHCDMPRSLRSSQSTEHLGVLTEKIGEISLR